MKAVRLALPLALGLLLVAGTLAGLAQAAGATFREAELPGAAAVEEIYLGSDGNLWISDYDANRVYQVNPVTGAYKRFSDLLGAADAQLGPGGYVWWLSTADYSLGRLEVANGEVMTWTLGVDLAWGLAFDEQGRVWVGDYGDGKLIRFDPTTHQRCTFTLPNRTGGYLTAHAGAIWYGDDQTGLGRLNTTTNANTFWDFPGSGFGAWSVAINGADEVWFVDDNRALVGRLDPVLNTVTTYTSSLLDHEATVVARGEFIWFTDQAGLLVGLDPADASGTTAALSSTTSTPGSTCIDAGSGVTHTAATATGTLGFGSATFTSTVENGMTHYALPAGSHPYGLANANGDLWFVDLNRQTLTILEAWRVYLPVVTR